MLIGHTRKFRGEIYIKTFIMDGSNSQKHISKIGEVLRDRQHTVSQIGQKP